MNFIMNGTVMLCLTLSHTSSRLEVLVRGADGTITPKQGEGVEEALRVKMKENSIHSGCHSGSIWWMKF